VRVRRKAGCGQQNQAGGLRRSLAHRDLGKESKRMNGAEGIRLDV